jgi:hypothetical protein
MPLETEGVNLCNRSTDTSFSAHLGGSILPDSLLLGGGTGTGQFVLSGRNDAQTITVSNGNKSGPVVVNAKFNTTLEGNPNDSANEAIPPLEFFADGDDYSNGHPALSGM